MTKKVKRICVYCGSSAGRVPEYVQAAQQLANELVRNHIGLVYGGASVGVMGQVADAVLAQNGEVIGVIPQALVDKEVSHNGLTQLHVVSSMHERKSMMADLANGFVALPGGLGTLEELFEVLTWQQLGFHQKPVAVLNVNGYYDKLLAFLDHSVAEKFVRQAHREALIVENNATDLVAAMQSYQAKNLDKWM